MLYPLFLNLSGKRCVVIGAGAVAEKRIVTMQDAGAAVRVVAPQATPAIKHLSSIGSISWMRSLYHPAHLEGAFLVLAATDLREINESVVRDANERNILVCAADDPASGNYLTGASIERGGLQLAVTTGGASPTLTAVLKRRLEEQFDEDWDDWVRLLAQIRGEIQSLPTESSRRDAVEAILNNLSITTLLRDGRPDDAEEAAKQCISSLLV